MGRRQPRVPALPVNVGEHAGFPLKTGKETQNEKPSSSLTMLYTTFEDQESDLSLHSDDSSSIRGITKDVCHHLIHLPSRGSGGAVRGGDVWPRIFDPLSSFLSPIPSSKTVDKGYL